MIRCVDVVLTIPDNEALTALRTLQRLGLDLGGLERADLYRCEVEPQSADRLVETLRGLETVFNPNKHELRIRSSPLPGPGEVWVDEAGWAQGPRAGPVRIAGRTLPGVVTLERFTAWRLFGAPGEPAPRALVEAATETLLCNRAFQKAVL